MKLMIANEAHDEWTELEVIDIKKEGESLAIVTPPFTIIVGPLNEFAETVVDLVGSDGEEAKRS
jgi:hypothetical protein